MTFFLLNVGIFISYSQISLVNSTPLPNPIAESERGLKVSGGKFCKPSAKIVYSVLSKQVHKANRVCRRRDS